MGRPSLKEERKQQVLLAAERVVIKHGVGGLTLESVANEAGLARPLIRHNVGNRDQIIQALADSFIARSNDIVDEYLGVLPEEQPFTKFVELLFDRRYSDAEFVLLANALLMEGAINPDLKKTMQNWTDYFIQSVYSVARRQFQQSEQANVMDCAMGVCGLYFSVESMMASGEIEGFRRGSLNSAMVLISSLD